MYGSLDTRTAFGVPASTLAWQTFSPRSTWNERVPGFVGTPRRRRHGLRHRGLAGTGAFGEAIYVTPLLPEYEKGLTTPFVPAMLRAQPVLQTRTAQVAALGAPSGFMGAPFGKPLSFDKETKGVQGTFLSPGWFADMFTVSPAEKRAREADKKAKKAAAEARKAEKRGDRQEAKMYDKESKRLKQLAIQERKTTRVESAAAIKLKKADARGKKFDVGGALETGAGMVTDIFGNQELAPTDITAPTDLGADVVPVSETPSVPTGVWYALGAVAVAGVGYAIYKRVT